MILSGSASTPKRGRPLRGCAVAGSVKLVKGSSWRPAAPTPPAFVLGDALPPEPPLYTGVLRPPGPQRRIWTTLFKSINFYRAPERSKASLMIVIDLVGRRSMDVAGLQFEVVRGAVGTIWGNLGPVWGPKGPKPAPNRPQMTPAGPRTNSNCSHISCSHIHRSPSRFKRARLALKRSQKNAPFWLDFVAPLVAAGTDKQTKIVTRGLSQQAPRRSMP